MSLAPLDLSQLHAAQRRCLGVLGEVPDLAHAARKLHWSQAALKTVLAELQVLLGQTHICTVGARVGLSDALKEAIEKA